MYKSYVKLLQLTKYNTSHPFFTRCINATEGDSVIVNRYTLETIAECYDDIPPELNIPYGYFFHGCCDVDCLITEPDIVALLDEIDSNGGFNNEYSEILILV